MVIFTALLSLLGILKISSVSAFEIQEAWNAEYSPELIVNCSELDRLCIDLCNNETKCVIPQKVCKDCIGTSVLMTNIFERMGVGYRNAGEAISEYTLVDLIKSGNFVTFTSRSIYNQNDTFDSRLSKERFQSLCSNSTPYPVVFFGLRPKSTVLSEVKYVACGAEIYKMTATPDIIDGLKLKSLRFSYPLL